MNDIDQNLIDEINRKAQAADDNVKADPDLDHALVTGHLPWHWLPPTKTVD